MVVQDGTVPGGGVYVGVDFGGEDAFVAKHFLDYAEVGPVLNQMRGKTVAESVRGYFFVNACRHGLILYEVEDRNAAEGFSEAAQEEIVVIGHGCRSGAGGEIAEYGVGRHFSKWDQPLLVSLADYIYKTFFKMDMGHAKPGSLAHAEPAAIEHFQDGPVPWSVWGRQIHRLDYGAYFIYSKDLRKVFSQLWRFHPVAGILLYLPVLHAPGEETSEGTQNPCAASLGQPAGRELSHVCRHVICANFSGLLPGMVQEFPDVVAVGCNRIWRHPPLYSEICPEISDKG